ncbi:hypothetical protein GCK72_025496 [Caenorhabditis remanei]|uniref:Uncharacterized protein n=1 Tax=Caenorhabditis remanei TaxID=31234 RepID=E3MJD6_CAERE|nr:hypothetical protein GCK72_025496 [Caenorhabditis remanei]EFP03672.1 hypothetical protein CRE_19113 [Caenorhabditis remanei]KAF1749029.1 hypothetical protein GCK72_025496 [Caenorhabditis remanei]
MTGRFQIPQQNFFTPEDATTWAVIFKTRYLNDCLQNILDSNKIDPADIKTELNCDENATKPIPVNLSAVKYEDSYRQLPFSHIRYKRQKPNLFGNSIVVLNMTPAGPHNKENCKSGIKRQAPATTSTASKRSK